MLLKSTPRIYLTIDGVTASVKSWSWATGRLEDTIYGRYRRGWSHEDCVFLSPKHGLSPVKYMNRPKIKVLYRGKQTTIPELCRARGTLGSLAYNRIQRGWSIEDAVDLPPGAKRVA